MLPSFNIGYIDVKIAVREIGLLGLFSFAQNFSHIFHPNLRKLGANLNELAGENNFIRDLIEVLTCGGLVSGLPVAVASKSRVFPHTFNIEP